MPSSKPFQSVAFVVNRNKPNAQSVAQALSEIATNAGRTARVVDGFNLPDDLLKDMDLCCVVGGDGTFLSAVPQAIEHQVPIMGVNLGKLGFLCNFKAVKVQENFLEVLDGNYALTQRALLNCQTSTGDSARALNDIVIKQYASSRLIELEVFCNDELVTELWGDGLIFASATGSTAYNLSAGGPIIHPGAKVFAMTPICPHTLSNRSVVFDQNTRLKINCKQEETTCELTLDGRMTIQQPAPFSFEIFLAQTTLSLVQPTDFSHFNMVRTKLKWGSSTEPHTPHRA